MRRKDEALLKPIKIGNKNPLVLIAGPCVIEDEKTTMQIAENLSKICGQYNIPLIFKLCSVNHQRFGYKTEKTEK